MVSGTARRRELSAPRRPRDHQRPEAFRRYDLLPGLGDQGGGQGAPPQEMALPPGHTVTEPGQYWNAQAGSLAGRLGHSSRQAAPIWHVTTLHAPRVQVNAQVLWAAQ